MSTTLYQFWRSSASWRVRWALAIKGIPFTSVVVDILQGEQLSPEHRARNPMAHVPALFIDGRTLAESVAILEYLEETRPSTPLYPKDPWARARVRQVVELVNSGVQPLQNIVTQQRHSPDHDEQAAWTRFFNERGMAAAEALLGTIAEEIPGVGSLRRGRRAHGGGRFPGPPDRDGAPVRRRPLALPAPARGRGGGDGDRARDGRAAREPAGRSCQGGIGVQPGSGKQAAYPRDVRRVTARGP